MSNHKDTDSTWVIHDSNGGSLIFTPELSDNYNTYPYETSSMAWRVNGIVNDLILIVLKLIS